MTKQISHPLQYVIFQIKKNDDNEICDYVQYLQW